MGDGNVMCDVQFVAVDKKIWMVEYAAVTKTVYRREISTREKYSKNEWVKTVEGGEKEEFSIKTAQLCDAHIGDAEKYLAKLHNKDDAESVGAEESDIKKDWQTVIGREKFERISARTQILKVNNPVVIYDPEWCVDERNDVNT